MSVRTLDLLQAECARRRRVGVLERLRWRECRTRNACARPLSGIKDIARALGSPRERSIARFMASPRSAPRPGHACSAWPRRSAIDRTSPHAICSRADSCGFQCSCPSGSRSSGIRCAKASEKPPRRSRPALHVDFRSYPRLGEGDVPLFEARCTRAPTDSSSRRAIRPRWRHISRRPRDATFRSCAS